MNGTPYSIKEISTIREYAGVKSIEEISKILGRPKGSIANKAYKERISLCRGEVRRKHTERNKETIREDAGTRTAEEIWLIIGRTQRSVSSLALRMGISLKKIGQDHYKAKLSNLQVEMINTLFTGGFKACEIHQAAFNHVAANTIYSITSCWSRQTK